jgi:RecB family exonuclease
MRPRAGARDAWPAFELAEGDDVLQLRGTIDRVDRAHRGAGVRVTDYKRSLSTVRAAASTLGTSAIQVPLYAAVAERNLAAPATGRYLPTQPRDLNVKPSSKAKARMEELLAHDAPGSLSSIEARALELVRALRGGRFAPTPADESQCTFCPVSGACRKPRFAMAPAEDDEESSS